MLGTVSMALTFAGVLLTMLAESTPVAPVAGTFLLTPGPTLLLIGFSAMRHSVLNQQPDQISLSQIQQDYEYALLAKYAYKTHGSIEPQAGTFHQVGKPITHVETPAYYARLFDSGQEFVLAFSGTDDHLNPSDWPANICLSLFGNVAQYRHAIDDAQRITVNNPGRQIRLGHSLGGGLASVAALPTVRPATTFNAAGVHPNRVGGDSSSPNSLIRAYRVPGDILSMLQDAFLPGLLLPGGVGETFYLEPTSRNAISRHFIKDVLSGKRLQGAS